MVLRFGFPAEPSPVPPMMALITFKETGPEGVLQFCIGGPCSLETASYRHIRLLHMGTQPKQHS